MKIDIPSEVLTALELINDSGHEAYLVGGCVRDFLMNKIPVDYDIATSSKPHQIKEIFSQYRTYDRGIKHGTVGVNINDIIIEITTYRIDGEYLDARHPSEVIFTNLLRDDLQRRDFTINALALNKDYQIIDYFDGIKDIKSQIIKTVGNPQIRFNEDALRILRALRFSSTLDFQIEQLTSRAIISNYQLLEKVSKERIYTEFKKLLLGINVAPILADYQLVIEFIINQELNHYDFLASKIDHIKLSLLPRLTFFLLGCDSKKIAIKILHDLRVDNVTIRHVKTLLDHLKVRIEDKITIKQVLKVVGQDLFLDLIQIKAIVEDRSYEKIKNIFDTIIKDNECYSLDKLAINGQDLNSIGIIGIKNGEILSLLLDNVIEEKVENDREKLLKFAKTL